ncbi:hypothetical protein COCON_G00174420 [Conger conger]|uniref:LRRNT domain-containing protein n=1 Tax=Conger conger TaxID=82655 RepID=A0A9Q1HQR3_CONCO|nr:hypothetical protein COCON_G00174420 [Conger conger]
MKEIVLLCLLALCRAKPYEPINIMSFLKHHDIMLQDDAVEDDDDDDGNFLFPSMSAPPHDESCPFGCQCSLRVIQCSDLGLKSVPKNIPKDALMIDLQNNKITEIKENDFKDLKNLYALFLVNNKISKIHPKAFRHMNKLQLLYLSYNLLTQIPANLPQNILELRVHDNKISKVQKDAFRGMRALHVLEMSANPLANSGIELGAFDGMSTFYLRIAEAKITAIPKDLPPALTELHLDYNKIGKVELEVGLQIQELTQAGVGLQPDQVCGERKLRQHPQHQGDPPGQQQAPERSRRPGHPQVPAGGVPPREQHRQRGPGRLLPRGAQREEVPLRGHQSLRQPPEVLGGAARYLPLRGGPPGGAAGQLQETEVNA